MDNIGSTMFSVIIPVYNAEKYVEKCIKSVLSQTYSNFEIIAINDESKDSSYSILRDLAKLDTRVHVYSHKNMGPGMTRNEGIKLAQGDYIVFLDSDDYVENDYFQLLDQRIQTEKSDVIFIDIVQEATDGNIICEERISKYKSLTKHDFICSQMTGKIPWGGVRKVVKRSLINERKICYTNDSVGEEAIYSFELLRHSKNYSFVDKNVYHYVNHPGSQSKKKMNENSSFVVNGWIITAEKMLNHLIEENLLADYKDAINAFGFTALIGWLLNNIDKPVFILRTKFVELMNDFERTYGWDINASYLRKENRLILPFVKRKILMPFIIAGKIRARSK